MGFKVGSGLGKDGEGRKEPVPINEVKTDKKGIGKAIKEKSDKQFIKNNIMQRQKSKYFMKNFMSIVFCLAFMFGFIAQHIIIYVFTSEMSKRRKI